MMIKYQSKKQLCQSVCLYKYSKTCQVNTQYQTLQQQAAADGCVTCAVGDIFSSSAGVWDESLARAQSVTLWYIWARCAGWGGGGGGGSNPFLFDHL